MSRPPWTRSLPSGWQITRLRHACDVANSNVDKKSYEDGLPVRLCNYTDVYYNDVITNDMPFMEATASRDEYARFRLRAGDVIITKDSESWDDIAVPACVEADLDDVVCGYHLSLFRPHADRLHGPFLLRALQAQGVREQFWLAANGVTRYGLGQLGMKDALLPLPPLPTQRAIANFLDHKTRAIDELIQKKEKLLELLAEKRAAVIQQAVTKGLDPNVPMKESGIDWIGRIPEHWRLIPARWATKHIKTGGTPPTSNRSYFEDGDVAWFAPASFSPHSIALGTPKGVLHQSAIQEGKAPLFDAGATLIIGIGATLGRVATLVSAGTGNQQILALEFPSERFDSTYAAYQFKYREQVFMGLALFTTLPIINQHDVGSHLVIVPPVSEQRSIVADITHKLELIARTAEAINSQIAHLTEYRQALITAAVTGQVDIPSEFAA